MHFALIRKRYNWLFSNNVFFVFGLVRKQLATKMTIYWLTLASCRLRGSSNSSSTSCYKARAKMVSIDAICSCMFAMPSFSVADSLYKCGEWFKRNVWFEIHTSWVWDLKSGNKCNPCHSLTKLGVAFGAPDLVMQPTWSASLNLRNTTHEHQVRLLSPCFWRYQLSSWVLRWCFNAQAKHWMGYTYLSNNPIIFEMHHVSLRMSSLSIYRQACSINHYHVTLIIM